MSKPQNRKKQVASLQAECRRLRSLLADKHEELAILRRERPVAVEVKCESGISTRLLSTRDYLQSLRGTGQSVCVKLRWDTGRALELTAIAGDVGAVCEGPHGYEERIERQKRDGYSGYNGNALRPW